MAKKNWLVKMANKNIGKVAIDGYSYYVFSPCSHLIRSFDALESHELEPDIFPRVEGPELGTPGSPHDHMKPYVVPKTLHFRAIAIFNHPFFGDNSQ